MTSVSRINCDIEEYLAQRRRIFREFRLQDSGCLGYGVEVAGRRYFVKHSSEPRGMASLRRAVQVNRAITHPSVPRFHNTITTPTGLALVYDWVDGEPLRKQEPGSAGERFRSLPVVQICRAIDCLFDLHVKLADLGFIAVDLYDGCFLYDFASQHLWVIDLDEYRRGPFILETERNLGSTRFMAPEELVRGAAIDQITNVFTLARSAFILLGQDNQGRPEHFRGSAEMKRVLEKATTPKRAQRHQSVREFVAAWRAACADIFG